MSSQICKKNNFITSTLILNIHNNLRSLGIRSACNGYRLLFECIKLAIINYDEINLTNIQLFPIYEKISIQLNKSPKQIENMIYYTITHRNYTTCIKNFEKVFGYSYDDEIFSNKEFINEFICMLKINSYF